MPNTINYEKEISKNKNLINNYHNSYNANTEKIKKLEKEYEKLSQNMEATKKTERYLEDFEDMRNSKCNKLKGISNMTFVKKYVESMTSINNSSHRRNAYDSITYSKEKLLKKMNDILDRIEELKNENRRYLNKIDNCKYDIQKLKIKQENE